MQQKGEPSSRAQSPSSPIPAVPTERQRSATSHPLAVYDDFLIYISYVLYSPLYIAGPIISFNNFQSQVSPHYTTSSLRRRPDTNSPLRHI